MATAKIGGPIVQSWADASVAAESQLRTETSEVEENGKRYKVVTSYKIVNRIVPRAVAERKKWKKFGNAANDGPGPNIATTFASETIPLVWVSNQAEQELVDDKKEEGRGNAGVAAHCRLCKSDDHWSSNCPLKSYYQKEDEKSDSLRTPASGGGAYVPPGARGGDRVGVERRNDENTCRVTNLPEDMPNLEEQLRDMFGAAGRIERFYLARDKATNRLRGFAFVTYESRQNTQRAIEMFNNARFGHLILKVEWTKPANN
ncbi:unnamed protein product [Bursaphelenchus xylophilus]|uniref:Eukaryotic translation initiation factor 3 subunit G n=1 Tax=Bursaphelenchus xylophilus TaxID=6326 RepID=A0A1I7S9C9_BURXY|nr:unnamed protein product [Bursaphelenchus xylophilus]CAG9100527.1 unnamed protein product [Bursaphelenchus xylophilus]